MASPDKPPSVRTGRPPAEFAARRRRWRIWYTAGVSLVVLAAGGTMAVAIGDGEAAHATLRTSSPAAGLPGGPVSAHPALRWATSDHPASGDPLWVGTVITWSSHQLSGRDARTGAVRWSYRRTDATVCAAAQRQGTAFVLFRRGSNCDELSTFDASTGARGWYRTLADDGAAQMTVGNTGLILTYPGSIHLIVAETGIDRYDRVVQPAGCTISTVAAGSAGVLYTQDCADGRHLVLQDNVADRQSWRVPVGPAVVAASAGQLVTSYDPSGGQLQMRSAADGTLTSLPVLSPTPAGSLGTATEITGATLLPIAGRMYALTPQGVQIWSLASRGPATQQPTNPSTTMIATAAGASQVVVATGTVARSFTFPAASEGARVYPAGAGLLVAGAGVNYLR